MSIIKDLFLASEGKQKIEWVKRNMPVLNQIEKDFIENQPFSGINILVSIHVEAKTAYLAIVLKNGGAKVAVAACNPLSTQDDVAAALVSEGIETFAVHGADDKLYLECLEAGLATKPDLFIDDGGDLVNLIHTKHAELIDSIIGGSEETTTGINRLIALEDNHELKIPMVLTNNAKMKHLFDNRYGTGQSVFDGINRTTNLIVAGKYVVVAGYGWCGKGIAMRARGLGAKVIVTEIDSIKAIEAIMDGFEVMAMDEASRLGDLFITVTGCKDVLTLQHFVNMKDGAILCNAGHFDVEINISKLLCYCDSHQNVRNNIEEYVMPSGNRLYILADGRLVNLVAGDGHPAEIMDMSFSVQALVLKYLLDYKEVLQPVTYYVPSQIDKFVANMKLKSLGIHIDSLTEDQLEYLYR